MEEHGSTTSLSLKLSVRAHGASMGARNSLRDKGIMNPDHREFLNAETFFDVWSKYFED